MQCIDTIGKCNNNIEHCFEEITELKNDVSKKEKLVSNCFKIGFDIKGVPIVFKYGKQSIITYALLNIAVRRIIAN